MTRTKRVFNIFSLVLLSLSLFAQGSSLEGALNESNGQVVGFANIALYSSLDSSLIKVETSNENGIFKFSSIENGSYNLLASFIGYNDYGRFIEISGKDIDLGLITFEAGGIELETATVTARRAIVEVKADRTVFNVEGTINAAGNNGIELLRKAPGVLVDNNDNITVLGRSGVLVYVDGKRLPLQGTELTNYIQNLTSSQLDRIDIITNPGAKYEAEGNAGIIDIRLKRIKEVGANGIISTDLSQGRHPRGNLNATGNYKNGTMNTYGAFGIGHNEYFNDITFDNFQNNLLLQDSSNFYNEHKNISFRLGSDINVGNFHSLGFLVSGNTLDEENSSRTTTKISPSSNAQAIDSILLAGIDQLTKRTSNTFNIYYAFLEKETSLNFDLDYGRYRNTSVYEQPNRYVSPDQLQTFAINNTRYDTPTDIDIYSAKLDYEMPLASGKLGLGGKLSKVQTTNSFKFYDIDGENEMFNDTRSNEFDYDEKVYAIYGNYHRALSNKVNFTGGLRVEITDAEGDLRAFRDDLQEDPVLLNYVSYFPNLGFTFQQAPNKVWSVNYSKRINRPDYNVLNPFEIQISELSFMKGNESLNPEIVNNLELGFTYGFMYNLKLSYSKTNDQITRLIGPNDRNERASFISWDNIASQTVIAFNFSAPITINSWWNAYLNLSVSHIDNQADYGDGAVVDVQAFSYNIFQQQTLTLGKGYTGEVSGYFAGPGVWGGVFEYDSNYALNLGIQKKFFNKLNVKVAASDITYQSGWSGFSEFNGLRGEGEGNWDSRRVSLTLSYALGSSKYKTKKRSTGIEDESSRVK